MSESSASPRRRPGRPSKGPREVVKALVPAPLKAAAAERAGAQGLNLNDYIQQLIARDVAAGAGEQLAISEVQLKQAG
ncbi:hypothetical protein GP2_031_00120 [Gordonia paraffinivorans NBRC 108238]|uniref:Toxin-antitoxin system HicB family antitoxin n=1 Tax=Gordonia paraffinivorans NBRC 108238 TaxID=1223543 RepID=A0ABQ0INR8_9ACTN|nr:MULTISPECIES: hypothetical protein [Gordonia]GAC85201.1 hypothetical protein GP2_031_00120 [Gordonia paraffinivorans NBRC 108238]